MRARAAAAGACALLLLAGCGGQSEDQSLLGSGPTTQSARLTPGSPAALLASRVEALRAGDLREWMAPVRGGAAFREAQRLQFANLRQLPVARLQYRLGSGGDVVRLLRLDSFDDAVEQDPAGFTVRRSAHGSVVVRGPSGRQPWDLVPIRVLLGPHVMVVYDAASAGEATRIRDLVAASIPYVHRTVPGDWSQNSVVYLFTSPSVLASYASVPGGNITNLGAVTYPVYGGPDGRRLVAMRMALLPQAVNVDPVTLGRIVRHELTHQALGPRGQDVPVWLSEGVAEYVGAKPLTPQQTRISTMAVARARAGLTSMPSGATFNGVDQDVNYSVAWMACSQIAAQFGEAMLWDLLDAMHTAHVGRDGNGQDAVLRQLLGYDSHRLAALTAQRIVRLFGAGR